MIDRGCDGEKEEVDATHLQPVLLQPVRERTHGLFEALAATNCSSERLDCSIKELRGKCGEGTETNCEFPRSWNEADRYSMYDASVA